MDYTRLAEKRQSFLLYYYPLSNLFMDTILTQWNRLLVARFGKRQASQFVRLSYGPRDADYGNTSRPHINAEKAILFILVFGVNTMHLFPVQITSNAP